MIEENFVHDVKKIMEKVCEEQNLNVEIK